MRVYLKDLTRDDWELQMAWRSLPAIYEIGCYTQKTALSWKEHYDWMMSRGRWWKFFLIMVESDAIVRKVGIVNFGQLENWNPEFNYYLGESSAWGNGIGKEALSKAIEWLKGYGYCKLHTTVGDGNARSINLMKSLGFKNVGEARKGESVWELRIAEEDKATEYTSGRRAIV